MQSGWRGGRETDWPEDREAEWRSESRSEWDEEKDWRRQPARARWASEEGEPDRAAEWESEPAPVLKHGQVRSGNSYLSARALIGALGATAVIVGVAFVLMPYPNPSNSTDWSSGGTATQTAGVDVVAADDGDAGNPVRLSSADPSAAGASAYVPPRTEGPSAPTLATPAPAPQAPWVREDEQWRSDRYRYRDSRYRESRPSYGRYDDRYSYQNNRGGRGNGHRHNANCRHR